MARSASFVCLRFFALALVLSCGGGPAGPLVSTSTESPEPPGPGRESPGAGRERAAGGREAPAATQDPAPPSQDPSGGGVGGGASQSCAKCDTKYVCSGTSSGQVVKDAEVALKNRNGDCIIDGQANAPVLTCKGKITIDGQIVGSWQTTNRGFSFNGQGVSLDCKAK